jgi:hypothetical protein
LWFFSGTPLLLYWPVMYAIMVSAPATMIARKVPYHDRPPRPFEGDTVSVRSGTMQSLPIRPTSIVISLITQAVGQEKSGSLTHWCAAGTRLHDLDARHDDHERMVPLWRHPIHRGRTAKNGVDHDRRPPQ